MFLNLQDKGLLLRIDAQALKVLDTWNVAPCGQPSAMDMDKEHERVFIGCRSGAFAAVDGNSGRVITTMPIGPGVDALEFDAAKGLIYVSSGGDGSLSIFHEDTPDNVFARREGDDRSRRADAGGRSQDGTRLPAGRTVQPCAGGRARTRTHGSRKLPRAGVRADRQIGDERVLRLARSMRDDHWVPPLCAAAMASSVSDSVPI